MANRKSLLSLIGLLWLLSGCGKNGAALQIGEVGTLEERYAEQVLLSPEYGESQHRFVRWTKSPTISLFNANSEQRGIAHLVISEINQVIEGSSLQLLSAADNQETADIQIVYAPYAQLSEIAEARGFHYDDGNMGYFSVKWNSAYEIERVLILIASDKLHGPTLRHFSFEEITQSLGLMNDSPLFDDSVFFAHLSDGGNAQNLSLLDRKLLRFAYTRLNPGDGVEEIRSLWEDSLAQ